MATSRGVRAAPLFLFTLTATSSYMFVVRPWMARSQVDRIRDGQSLDVSIDSCARTWPPPFAAQRASISSWLNPMALDDASERANPKRRFLYPATSFSELSVRACTSPRWVAGFMCVLQGGRSEGVSDPRYRR
jgi:hypothetical protein